MLLDQGVAAGVGNIYADEALFRSPVSAPLRAARRPRRRGSASASTTCAGCRGWRSSTAGPRS
ncbi:MAG: hypothetical protein IPI34_15145 [bacterium]|nr:hypothetical protein [bacterium]